MGGIKIESFWMWEENLLLMGIKGWKKVLEEEEEKMNTWVFLLWRFLRCIISALNTQHKAQRRKFKHSGTWWWGYRLKFSCTLLWRGGVDCGGNGRGTTKKRLLPRYVIFILNPQFPTFGLHDQTTTAPCVRGYIWT